MVDADLVREFEEFWRAEQRRAAQHVRDLRRQLTELEAAAAWLERWRRGATTGERDDRRAEQIFTLLETDVGRYWRAGDVAAGLFDVPAGRLSRSRLESVRTTLARMEKRGYLVRERGAFRPNQHIQALVHDRARHSAGPIDHPH